MLAAGSVTLMDGQTLTALSTLKVSTQWCETLRFSPDDRFLAVGSHDNRVYVLDVVRGPEPQLKLVSHLLPLGATTSSSPSYFGFCLSTPSRHPFARATAPSSPALTGPSIRRTSCILHAEPMNCCFGMQPPGNSWCVALKECIVASGVVAYTACALQTSGATQLRDAEWASWTSPFGWPVQVSMLASYRRIQRHNSTMPRCFAGHFPSCLCWQRHQFSCALA